MKKVSKVGKQLNPNDPGHKDFKGKKKDVKKETVKEDVKKQGGE